jgi:hypothetical protein
MPDMKEMLGIREVLQNVEDALIDNGWDEIIVRTDNGLFTWVSDKRAAEVEEEDGAPEPEY